MKELTLDQIQALSELKTEMMSRPFVYWLHKRKIYCRAEGAKIDGYDLTIFCNQRHPYSTGWLNTDVEKLRPLVEYLEEHKVERGSDSLDINNLDKIPNHHK